MKQLTMYIDIEISEKQIEAGRVKDARTALKEMRALYFVTIFDIMTRKNVSLFFIQEEKKKNIS